MIWSAQSILRGDEGWQIYFNTSYGEYLKISQCSHEASSLLEYDPANDKETNGMLAYKISHDLKRRLAQTQ